MSSCSTFFQLKYLREKRHELGLDFDDDDDGGGSVGHNQEPSLEAKLDGDEVAKEDKKKKQRGMLGWFKLLVNKQSLYIFVKNHLTCLFVG